MVCARRMQQIYIGKRLLTEIAQSFALFSANHSATLHAMFKLKLRSIVSSRRAEQFKSFTSKLRVSNKLKCRVRPLSAVRQENTTRSTSSNRLQFPPLPREWETKYVPGQMYKYQNALPKLPVPPLKQTLDKFMSSVEVC